MGTARVEGERIAAEQRKTVKRQCCLAKKENDVNGQSKKGKGKD